MLGRKMLRDIKHNFGQFFSIFLLSFLAVSLFTIFKSSDIGAFHARNAFHNKTNLADGWIYGEKFTKESLKKVQKIPEVKEAQLRTRLSGSSMNQNQAQIDLFLEDENEIIKPYIIEGKEFDPNDTEHLWISEKFAKEWNLAVGDSFSMTYNGVAIKKKIGGLIASPEYEYMCADTDLETDYKNIGYVYLSYRGFPIREYVKHMIETGKLNQPGMTKKTLLEQLSKMSSKELFTYLPYTQILITTDRSNVLSLEKEIAKALNKKYAVFMDQKSVTGIKVFTDELNQHEQFAIVFAAIFVLIALLVIMTTMNRMVANQRIQIGTLNALGMKNGKIIRHYMSYSFLVSLLGSALGLLVGPLWWGQAFTNLFATMYVLPGWKPSYDSSFYLVALLVILCCTMASFLSCRRLLKVRPSDCLRPAQPKMGKTCIFEKLPFWRRLGFNTQYDLRDITRARLRAFMCVFGTACGMMIVTCALACNTTVDNVYDWSFSKLQNYDYDVQFSKDITLDKADSLARRYDGELVMTKGIEVATKANVLATDKYTTSFVVTEGKGKYGVTDVEQKIVEIPENTVAISSKLAQKLKVQVGDVIYWHIVNKNTWQKSEIGLISRNPTFSGLTMLRKDYETKERIFEPTTLYTDRNVEGLKNKDYVTAVHNKTDLLKAFQSTMEIMNVLIAVFLVFAVILIVVVLYNSGNLSFHERIKEFATLKVLGFQSSQIRKILSIQNLWLSMIGVIIGAPFAKLMLQYMFDSNGDSFDFQAVVSIADYVKAGIFVLFVSVCVSFLFSKRIKRLDMVEVLKGME
ncbi:ABC transporter, permease protein [Lachnospiraceae bacterium KM106-2]|nr:ABC transporter, permease protein [Lachnospiraceae bacterium KM106-2]